MFGSGDPKFKVMEKTHQNVTRICGIFAIGAPCGFCCATRHYYYTKVVAAAEVGILFFPFFDGQAVWWVIGNQNCLKLQVEWYRPL